MGFGYLRDSFGNKSSKRLIAVIGSIIGYIVSIIVVLYGLGHVIGSPSTVNVITTTIVGAPFLALIATVFERKAGDKIDNNEQDNANS